MDEIDPSTTLESGRNRKPARSIANGKTLDVVVKLALVLASPLSATANMMAVTLLMVATIGRLVLVARKIRAVLVKRFEAATVFESWPIVG